MAMLLRVAGPILVCFVCFVCLAASVARAQAPDAAQQLVDRMLGTERLAQSPLDPEFEVWKKSRVAWLTAQMRDYCARTGQAAAAQVDEAQADAAFDRHFALHVAEWQSLTGIDTLPGALRERFKPDEIERALAYVSAPTGAPALAAWHRYQKTRMLGHFDDLLLRAMRSSRLRASSGSSEHEALDDLLDAHQARASRELRETLAAGSGQPLATIEWMQFINRFSALHREHGEAALQRLDLTTWKPLLAFDSLQGTMAAACSPTR